MTFAIPVQRSTNGANKPTGSWSIGLCHAGISKRYGREIFRYTEIEMLEGVLLVERRPQRAISLFQAFT